MKQQKTLRLSPAVLQLAKQTGNALGVSMANVFELAVWDFAAKHGISPQPVAEAAETPARRLARALERQGITGETARTYLEERNVRPALVAAVLEEMNDAGS